MLLKDFLVSFFTFIGRLEVALSRIDGLKVLRRRSVAMVLDLHLVMIDGIRYLLLALRHLWLSMHDRRLPLHDLSLSMHDLIWLVRLLMRVWLPIHLRHSHSHLA